MRRGAEVTSQPLKERVLDAIHNEGSPTRRVLRERELLRSIAALGVTLALFASSRGVRPGERPWSLLAATALGAAALAILINVLALGRGRSMLGRSAVLLWAVALGSPLALLAWKMGWTLHYDVLGPQRFGLRCLALSLAMGAAPFAVLLRSRRRSDPLHPSATGAAVGAAVGAMVWVLVDLWCPVGRPLHLLIGHVLPCLLLVVGGALLGRSWVALR
jgi:hypothetical protein